MDMDSENNAKVSDSAYSNSCSNSQSRRSHSSKSTHSGSNSSGSSGYGGKPSTSGSSNQPPEKRIKEKDPKKKKQTQSEIATVQDDPECRPPDPAPAQEVAEEQQLDVHQTPSPVHTNCTEKGPESMDIASPESFGPKDEVVSCSLPMVGSAMNFVTLDGFSCIISMHDGVVMYTTSSLTTVLGFPKDMWIGRSFIDFVHPRDRSTFASQITSGLAVPKIVNGTQEKVQAPGNPVSTMVCRIRRYRGLLTGYGVKERVVTYVPFLLKLTFKNISDEEGEVIYLVIQATPFFSAFKIPNEVVIKPVPFVMRHSASGNLEYIDSESVPYLGFLPQDLIGKDAIHLYHPDDLLYLGQMYKTIVREGGLPRSKPYRMLTQNGDYVKLETEWSSFINPWSRKLEFVIGKHFIIEGPNNPDVFQIVEAEKSVKITEDKKQQQALRENIVKIMNKVLTKPAEVAKQQMSKRCQDLAAFMERMMEEQPQKDEELRLEIQDPDHSYYPTDVHCWTKAPKHIYEDQPCATHIQRSPTTTTLSRSSVRRPLKRRLPERDSMLGGISPHHDCNDSKSSTETPLSYNQINYNENLQRYFDSHQPFSYDDYNTVTGENVLGLKDTKPHHPLSNCMSPMAQNSGDSCELASSCESGLAVRGSSPAAIQSGDYEQVRLTETLLNKHNTEMEKELLRIHRETRSSSKGEREKTSNENRQKKKEHLARCNASFQPTAVLSPPTATETAERNHHGVKRSSKQVDTGPMHKHHCPSSKQVRRRHVASAAVVQPSTAAVAAAVAGESSTHLHPGQMNNMTNMNTFFVGVGIPHQMSIMGPVMPQQMAPMAGIPGMPGIFPMYYAAAPSTSMATNTAENADPSKTSPQYTPQAMQCMVYGQAMYGSPFMYSPMPQVSCPMQQAIMAQTTQFSNTLNSPFNNVFNPLGLKTSNYNEACKPSQRSAKPSGVWRNKNRIVAQLASKTDHDSADSNSSTNDMIRESAENDSGAQSSFRQTDRYASTEPPSTNCNSAKSTEALPDTASCRNKKSKCVRMRNSEETVDRTDGESSYSSFYSSFFKTESGSAEDSGDVKKSCNKKKASTSDFWDKNTPDDQSSMDNSSQFFKPKPTREVPKRKMEPPWMEHVSVTSELIYKYQVLTRTLEEVLTADKQKMDSFSQPAMVNEQLGQLYLDLQLEGVAARLTLEEGITSSSSSGDETSTHVSKGRRKREYSKLVMIYEEDAPLPSPTEDELTSI